MTKQKGKKAAPGRVSAKQAAIQVLQAARKPLAVKEVAERVLANPDVSLGGKTPAATIAAILYTAPEFEKVERGVVKLRRKRASS